MAYMVHITRADGILLEDWAQAVTSTEGVRLAEGDYSVRLPETGQTFVLRNNGGDAELHLPHANEWRRAFRWEDGAILFVGTEEFGVDPACHLRSAARALAAALEAVVRGEDGRIFD